jgi:ubiquitin-conjugating enzyme E2 D/E
MVNLKRVMKEADTIKADKQFTVRMDEDNASHWSVDIKGPADTPFAGGTFVLEVTFPDKYPFQAPDCRMSTKIYHPNVSKEGLVCLDMLKGWKSSTTIHKILLAIVSLMTAPDLDNPFDTDIANQLLVDKNKYEETAKLWTTKYAM